MLALKWLLIAAGIAMFGTAAAVVGYDVYLAVQCVLRRGILERYG